MPISKKVCECGCGRTFHGTDRKRFATDYCRVKWHRQQAKDKGKSMFKADIVNGKPVVIQCGEMIEKGFLSLVGAQERAEELNEEHGYDA